MNRLAEKIILGLVALFLLSYVGYQAYIFMYGSMKTETVFEYTVSRSIPVDGVAIRSEVVLTGNYEGAQSYIYEDGTRVTVGENVAEFFASGRSNRDIHRARELEAEIKMLEEAQDGTVNNLSTTEILNRDIKEQLTNLSKLADDGRFEDISELRASLTGYINKKKIATGMETKFDTRIDTLKAEYENLDFSDENTAVTFLKAPVSGYFSKNIDGSEESLSLELAKDFTIHDYLSAIDGPAGIPQTVGYGKIVTDQNWLFAGAALKGSLEFVSPGQEVFLSFDTGGKKIPAVVEDVLQEKDEERTVLILGCNQISGKLLEIRNTPAVINFSQYTGLRINMSDVRFQDDKRGVFVLENNTVRFREIDPIYEEKSFVLSRLIQPNSQESRYVNLFDQVIIKGSDLYDGKVIL